MNRTLFISLGAVLALGIAMSGCKPPTVDYKISEFSTLRVMNFATTCGISNEDVSPMDAYFFPSNQSRPSQGQVYNLSYGQASVYSNLLPGTNDSIIITPHLIHSTDVQTIVDLAPQSTTSTGKYTFLVYVDPSTGNFVHTLLMDGMTGAIDTSKAYVRFINMEAGSGNLNVRVNDPNTGDIITSANGTSAPVGYGQVSAYTPIHSILDTSYTFIVTNASNQILARLAYQTFTSGNFYTLVYGGDLCNTLADNPADSLQSSSDTIRLRAFDDNTLGNDQTNPPTQTFRYNIVNDIIPSSYPYDQLGDTALGFLVNGNGFPEDSGFSIPPVPVYQGGGENQAVLVNGAYEVNYQSAVVPNPLIIQATATDINSSNKNLLFNAGGISKFNTANLLLSTNNGKAWSILLYDTVPSPTAVKIGDLDSNIGATHAAIIQMPDQSNPNYAKFVFVGGIVAVNKLSPQANYSLFYLEPSSGGTIVPSKNAQGGILVGNSDTISVPIAAGTTEPITVIDSIGTGKGTGNTRTYGNTQTFTAQAGGIYEIVSEGTKPNPHLLIMHVN